MATIGVTEKETISYTMAYYLPIGMTVAVLTTSLLAVLTFLLYNFKVSGGGEGKYFHENILIVCFSVPPMELSDPGPSSRRGY